MSEGYKVTIKKSCSNCKHCKAEYYRAQSDSGWDYYCSHPSFEERKSISVHDSPNWCPVGEANHE